MMKNVFNLDMDGLDGDFLVRLKREVAISIIVRATKAK